MKYIALLAVIGAALLAPSSASAQSGATNCPGGVKVVTPNVEVSVSPPNVNVSRTSVCVFNAETGAGGEAVLDPAGCSYVNAWQTNPGTPGYAGICTQTTTTSPGCDGQDNDPAGNNTGGCLWVKPAPADVNNAINSAPPGFAVTAMFICGNTSGEDPMASNRDGCSIP